MHCVRDIYTPKLNHRWLARFWYHLSHSTWLFFLLKYASGHCTCIAECRIVKDCMINFEITWSFSACRRRWIETIGMAKARWMKWRGCKEDNVIETANTNTAIVRDAYCSMNIQWHNYCNKTRTHLLGGKISGFQFWPLLVQWDTHLKLYNVIHTNSYVLLLISCLILTNIIQLCC